MKLNKEIAKKGFKNLLFSILHMFIFNIISMPIFILEFVDIKDTGETVGTGGILPSRAFECNPFFVILSVVLFSFTFSVFYTKYFKKDLIKHVKTHLLFILLFIAITAGFVFVEFIVYGVINLTFLGFGTFINSPDYILILACAYLIGYIVIDILISFRKKRFLSKKNNTK